MKILLILSLIILVFISGCVEQAVEEYNEPETSDVTEETENTTVVFDRNTAIAECERICQEIVSGGADLSNGPCLSDNNEDWVVTDWVCDVAHVPRQGIDELSANQCLEFRVNRAHHFVEVDENCKTIMAY